MSEGETPLIEGRNVWHIGRADRASIIVDADDYFCHARAAMAKARKRIMLIGWDFDARIALGDARADGGPECVGDLLPWLAERTPGLEIYLLRWDVGALKSLFRGKTWLTVLKWMRHPSITTKLDGAHPIGASHHQKLVVIDDCFAFAGGIDVTAGRWDTRDHAEREERRTTPDGKAYDPWHDATTALSGPIAGALGRLARDRWKAATGKTLPAVRSGADCWPEGLPVQFEGVDVGIARTAPEMPGCEAVTEIEQLYVDQIAAARRMIYAESQYFASRRLAEAIARRLEEPDGPEIVIINPESADGWLEPIAMDTARARLYEALRQHDRGDRFRLYHPYAADGTPIYVHAKIMVVDDCIVRVGSSNMNNRSMRLDTECDVTIDCALPANDGLGPTITAFRDGLIAEHLGLDPAQVSRRIGESGSLIAAIESLRGDGRSLRPYVTPDLNAVETWLADNKVLDPEGPSEMFEATNRRNLLSRLRWPRRNLA